jgi:hypothetical protein
MALVIDHVIRVLPLRDTIGQLKEDLQKEVACLVNDARTVIDDVVLG